MMKLKTIKPNCHALLLGRHDLFFSYETPVALADMEDRTLYITVEKFSRTSGGHVNQIRREYPGFQEFPKAQEFFENLEVSL